MRLDWLESFVHVAASGQISSAAIELHVSQSSLSRQMSALEADLGAALFVRGSRGVVLTPAGRLLHRRADQLLLHIHELHELVEAEVRDSSLVRVGIPPGLPSDWLRQHILAGPGEVVLNEWTTNEQLDFLGRGNLDIALTHERSKSLPSRLVLAQRLGVALPHGSAILDRVGREGTVDVRDLDGMKLMAHAASAVRSSEGILRSLAADAGAEIDWVFRRFNQYTDLVAESAKVDGVVTTEAHGASPTSWTWCALTGDGLDRDDLSVRTWVNWKSDAGVATRRFADSLPMMPGR